MLAPKLNYSFANFWLVSNILYLMKQKYFIKQCLLNLIHPDGEIHQSINKIKLNLPKASLIVTPCFLNNIYDLFKLTN